MLFVRGCKLRAPLYSLEVSSSDLGFGHLPNEESPQKKYPYAFTCHGLMVSSVSRVCQCFWCLFKELTNLTLALCLIVVKELHLHRREPTNHGNNSMIIKLYHGRRGFDLMGTSIQLLRYIIYLSF